MGVSSCYGPFYPDSCTLFDAEGAGRDSPPTRQYLTGHGVSREHGKFGEHWKNGPGITRSRRYRGAGEQKVLFVGSDATCGRVAAVQLSAPCSDWIGAHASEGIRRFWHYCKSRLPRKHTRTARLNSLAKSISTRSNVQPEEVLAGWAREITAGRVGMPEEFAAVAPLASQRASYVNGMSIVVDAGLVRTLL